MNTETTGNKGIEINTYILLPIVALILVVATTLVLA